MQEIRELKFHTQEFVNLLSLALCTKIDGIKEWHGIKCIRDEASKLYSFYCNRVPHVNINEQNASGFYFKSGNVFYYTIFKPCLYR